jgi:FtsH-binding integral membrane protein
MKHLRFCYCSFLIWVVTFFSETVAIAQDGGAPFAEATAGVKGMYSDIARLIFVVIVIAALFTLVAVVVKIMKGDNDAAVRLLWWFCGLVVGLTLMSVVGKVLGK